MNASKQQDVLIEQTLTLWQQRTKRKLSHEDAREIVANVTGFFQVLREWATKDHDDSETSPAQAQPCEPQK